MPGMPDCCEKDNRRFIHLLEAALPFLSPDWHRLADSLLITLQFTELIGSLKGNGLSRMFQCFRSNPCEDMSGLMCAIRPFCLESELQILNMLQQFQQMQKMYDMWSVFSSMMPEGSNPFSDFSGGASAGGFPGMDALAAMLTPEQREQMELLKGMFAG